MAPSDGRDRQPAWLRALRAAADSGSCTSTVPPALTTERTLRAVVIGSAEYECQQRFAVDIGCGFEQHVNGRARNSPAPHSTRTRDRSFRPGHITGGAKYTVPGQMNSVLRPLDREPAFRLEQGGEYRWA